MARKKRKVPKEFQAPVQEEKPTKAFQDEFQSTVGKKIEEFSKRFEGKGRTIQYALAAVGVLVLLVGFYYIWHRRSVNAAQTALGSAIEISQATVTDSPVPAGSTQKTYKTAKERAEAAIAAFQAVADKYGGYTGDQARYFIAVNRLEVDRAAAVGELTELAKQSGDVGALSKFALAQALTGDGKLDEAAALYSELSSLADPILSKETIDFELAKVYEKQDKKTEAADLYFNIAKAASEAKDPSGEPVPMSQTARDAKTRLEELNPEKAKEIQEPAPASPGGMPFG